MMPQTILSLVCLAIIGNGWRVQRPIAQVFKDVAKKEESARHDTVVSRTSEFSDARKSVAMMMFAHHPSVASRQFARRAVPSRGNFISAPRNTFNHNIIKMTAGEGEEDVDLASDAESDQMLAEEGAENGEDVDLPSDAEGDVVTAGDGPSSDSSEREKLKLSLLKMGAAYDRGYGATPSARNLVSNMIDDLERLNPTKYAARGVSGDFSQGVPPLQGNWRMVWTTAPDVISLASSPVATVGAIHQIIDLPVATNIIDLIPRPQNFLPVQAQLSSVLRAEVSTRTSARQDSPNRVGLTFEAVKLKPVEVLGFPADFLPPFALDFPRVEIPGSTPETTPGYFDITYLDDDMLIYRQGPAGGLFALIRVDSYDP